MRVEIKRKAFGDKIVMSELSLFFPEGESTLLMAPSGWGKTTLLRIMAGLDRDYEGRVEGNGGRSIILFQEDRLVEEISALSNLRALGKEKNVCIDILSALGLENEWEKKVRDLSGGMKRRVAIARMLLSEGEMYFLDEPFSGLDDKTREKTADLIAGRLSGK
ncbi:MAG: ATP-binding cassette domain-containing protein, partial [Candidatus Ornithospirochaeta sp.]